MAMDETKNFNKHIRRAVQALIAKKKLWKNHNEHTLPWNGRNIFS
jgi:hypothetical protein